MQEKRLDVLWKAHFVDRRVRAALETLIHEQAPSLIRLLRKKTTGLTAIDVRNSLKRADVQVGFPVSPTPPDPQPPPPRRPGSRHRPARRTGERKTPVTYAVTIKDLLEAETLKAPFKLEATWRKQPFEATVERDGSITFQGESYTSLSLAAAAARTIANGPPPDGRRYWQTNGWTFWKYRDAGIGKLELIDILRQRYLKERKAH